MPPGSRRRLSALFAAYLFTTPHYHDTKEKAKTARQKIRGSQLCHGGLREGHSEGESQGENPVVWVAECEGTEARLKGVRKTVVNKRLVERFLVPRFLVWLMWLRPFPPEVPRKFCLLKCVKKLLDGHQYPSHGDKNVALD